MAATFRAKASTNINGLNITVSKPAGTVDDDTMIAMINTNNSGTSLTPPAAWTLIDRTSDASGTGVSQAVYSKIASSEGASYTWVQGASTDATGVILSFFGGDPLEAIRGAVAQANVSSTEVAIPSLTMDAPDLMLVALYSSAGGLTFTAPTGMTEKSDEQSTLVSGSSAIEFSQGPGETGVRAAVSSIAGVSVGLILAIGPSRRILETYEEVVFGTEDTEEVLFT